MSKKNNETNVSLEQFTWDSDEFFDITPAVDQNQKVIDEINNEDDEDDEDDDTVIETNTTTEKPKKGEEEDEDFFDTKETKTEEVVDEDEEDDTEFFTTLTKELSDKKIFQHVSLTDDEKITEEKFFELQEQEIDGRLEEAIQDFITELNDEDGAAFIKFKRAGGKTSDFFAFYSQMDDDIEVSLEKEEGQDAVLRKWYKTVENLDEEDIQDKLDWLKEGGKKKKYAEKYQAKMAEEKKAAKDQFLQEQLDAQTEREKAKKKYVDTLKSTIDTTEAVGDFTFNKKEKPLLFDYLVKPAVKLKSNHYLTKFQSDLNEVVKNSPEKLLIIAKLLMNDFDTTDLVVKEQTKAVKQVKSSLTSKENRLTTKASSKKRSLSEFF